MFMSSSNRDWPSCWSQVLLSHRFLESAGGVLNQRSGKDTTVSPLTDHENGRWHSGQKPGKLTWPKAHGAIGKNT
jgi:hypothetical protein